MSQINSFLSKLLLVVVFHHSNSRTIIARTLSFLSEGGGGSGERKRNKRKRRRRKAKANGLEERGLQTKKHSPVKDVGTKTSPSGSSRSALYEVSSSPSKGKGVGLGAQWG